MRIGVVSDTHDNLRNVARIVALLNEAGVERVVHTGDITQPKTIHALSELQAPLVGVYGNNDVLREALDAAARACRFRLAAPPLELHWAGRPLLVVHDPRQIDGRELPPDGVVLHGHDHRHVEERRSGRLIFNPGECAGWLDGHNAVGVVDLVTLSVDLLRF